MLWVLIGVGLLLFTIAMFALVGLVLWRKARATLRTGGEISARASALAAEAGALVGRLEAGGPSPR